MGDKRYRLIALFGAAATVTALGAALPVAAASAAPGALPPDCTQPGSTVTCVYPATGAVQTFTPPAGVSSVTVSLTGASGGAGGAYASIGGPSFPGPGGGGATVTGAINGLNGQALTIYAGSRGQDAGNATVTAGSGGFGLVVSANVIKGSLACSGNSAASDAGMVNTNTGAATGQCASLAKRGG
jgi:hypothetical protein